MEENSENEKKEIIKQSCQTILAHVLNDSFHRLDKKEMSNLLDKCQQNSTGSIQVLTQRMFKIAEKMEEFNCTCDLNSSLPFKLKEEEQPYDYFIIIDFEKTHDHFTRVIKDNIPEEIEFPIIIYNVKENSIVDIFKYSYKKIANCPSQSSSIGTIYGAYCGNFLRFHRTFSEILEKIQTWLDSHSILQNKFALLTSKRDDICQFVRKKCESEKFEMPQWMQQWINVKEQFCDYYGVNRSELYSESFWNSHYAFSFSLSDTNKSKEVVKMVEQLINDGCVLQVNEKLNLNKPPEFSELIKKESQQIIMSLDATAKEGVGISQEECVNKLSQFVLELFKTRRLLRIKESEMKYLLEKFQQKTIGRIHILKKRLISLALKLNSLTPTAGATPSHPINLKFPQEFDYIFIIDFEATCKSRSMPRDPRPEIIEFPVILYDIKKDMIVDTFHSYCRPRFHRYLTNYCKNLTGISQETVNAAPYFTQVFNQVQTFLSKHSVFQHKYAVVCDNRADLSHYLRIQCDISNITMPHWSKQWINLKNLLFTFYNIPDEPRLNLSGMFSHFDESFNGRAHSGLNDAKNILRLMQFMLNDGCILEINEKLNLNNSSEFCDQLTPLKHQPNYGFTL